MDRQREPIVMRIRAAVLDGDTIDSRRVAHHRPLSTLAVTRLRKLEIGGRRSYLVLGDADFGRCALSPAEGGGADHHGSCANCRRECGDAGHARSPAR